MARPIRTQIVIIIACILVPLAAIVFWTGRLTFQQELTQIQTDAHSVAATLVTYIDHSAPASGPVDPTVLQAVIGSIPLPAGSVIAVADQGGVIVARSVEPERFVGHALAEGPPETVSSVGVRTAPDGSQRVLGTAEARGGYVVHVGIPLAAAWARTFPIYRRNSSWTGAFLLSMLLVTLVVVRRWLRAVRHLESAATRVAAGDLTDVPRLPMPSSEFEQLQETFAAMVARVRDARAETAAQVVEERRMREELQLLQRQVIRQERLAAIGVLVSGIAHELNNPLQAIYGFAELLNRRTDLPPDAREEIALIEKESARSAAIISNLSRFGRQHSPEPGGVTLGDVVESVMELRNRKLAEGNIDVVIDDRAHQGVRAVFTELQQVLLNFVINAEQAIAATRSDAGRITIRTIDARHAVRLEVEDTGPGVQSEDEPKLFQPFFSTKPVGEGTGLGLSVSYGIIQGYGGAVGYRRGATGGALFWFELPADGPPASPGNA